MKKLTVGSCFSGIGGLELGLEWTGGFETKWQIENDEYAPRVLAKHWPNVKRYTDIRTVSFPERVDVICGGFPCQDVSLAGARKGLEGKRSTLWGEMFRLVCEVKPRWVVAENVPGLLSSDDGRFFGGILRDLASAGFDAEWGVLSAAGVGAPHLRRRIFLVACAASEHGGRRNVGRIEAAERTKGNDKSERMGETKMVNSNLPGCSNRRRETSTEPNSDRADNRLSESSGENVADPERNGKRPGFCPDGSGRKRRGRFSHGGGAPHIPNSTGDGREHPVNAEGQEDPGKQAGREGAVERGSVRALNGSDECAGWWSTEPDVGRVAHGVPSRVDRLKCLGNAVVPQVAQKIGEMILRSPLNAPESPQTNEKGQNDLR